ncbi:hypothetical protein AAHC03_013153 [Spirometra sp. Aus1]
MGLPRNMRLLDHREPAANVAWLFSISSRGDQMFLLPRTPSRFVKMWDRGIYEKDSVLTNQNTAAINERLVLLVELLVTIFIPLHTSSIMTSPSPKPHLPVAYRAQWAYFALSPITLSQTPAPFLIKD